MRTTPHHPPPGSLVAGAAWCLVLLAAGLEIIWAFALDQADGLARPAWLMAGIAIAIVSLIMLTVALRTLPLGSAYALWVGIGAIGVASTDALILSEPLTPTRAACLALIVAGVVGLTMTDTPSNSTRAVDGASKPRDTAHTHRSGEI